MTSPRKPTSTPHVSQPEGAPMPVTMTTPPSTILLFTPRGPADRELEWFFTEAESDMGSRSNYVQSLSYVPPTLPDDTLDQRAEASHAQRTLLSWIRALEDFDAGVLKAAYAARRWPLLLRERFGRLTGLVVRLAAAEAGLPDDDAALAALEQRTALRLNESTSANEEAVARLARRASPILKAAFEAYVRERGGRETPVLGGIS